MLDTVGTTGVEVKPSTKIEEAISHLRENNTQLLAQLSNLRDFLQRATGQSLDSQPQSEKSLQTNGKLGELKEDLENQSSLITELKEIKEAIENIS